MTNKSVVTLNALYPFLATFINFYLQGVNINEVLDHACKIGAFVASQTGANPEYPDNLLK